MPSPLKLAAVLLAAVGAAGAGLAYLYRRPLPRINGTLKITGLHAPVEIIRDTWGVPHIYAQNEDDLFFAQGYVHAQDRLWQMELNRRIGQGRLSEIFGALTFSTDHLLRIIGLARAADHDYTRATPESRAVLDAYARGVNAFIRANRSHLPLEFTLLHFSPAPWQPKDSLVWAKVMTWGQGVNWDSEVLRAALIEKLGADRAARLLGEYNADNPLILHDHTFVEMLDRVGDDMRAAEKWVSLQGITGASNNWVVDGEKSATGKPLLANDPHLPLGLPSIWYENHLIVVPQAGDSDSAKENQPYQVAGVSLPGAPGILIGHNAEIAWGMTNAFADCQDVYVEKINPDDSTLYEYQGKWEKAQVLREEIRVRGETSPRKIEITITRHGPIINPWVPFLSNSAAPKSTAAGGPPPALALRWVGHDDSRSLQSIFALNRARDWESFTAALRDWTEPALNFVYADRAGNIGYYLAGNIPIRKNGKGLTPVPGWNADYEWTGYIPFDELPHDYNPPQHFFATANNQVVGAEYPHHLTLETLNGFRARRIVELLTYKQELTADDFARFQVDQYCAPARTFCALLLELEQEILSDSSLRSQTAQAAAAFDYFRGWTCTLTADSVPGALYETTQYYAMRRVFSPWLDPPANGSHNSQPTLTDHFLGVGFHPLLSPTLGTYNDRTYLTLQRILAGDEREWFCDAQGLPTTRVAILAGALGDALTFLNKTLGKNISAWQWGKLHRAGFNHPLGNLKPLDKIFNRGPYPHGGDTSTVWQAAFIPQLPISSEFDSTASWRQILDLSDWDASRAIHPGGQSGHPAAKHYADMIPLWRAGEYHPLWWSRDKIIKKQEATLHLVP